MIVVERKRLIAVPADRVRAVLADVDRLDQLLPRVERAEVLARSENRARLAVVVRLGRLGAQRIEGEARLLEHGLRFVAVEPLQIDARWTVLPREAQSDVIAQVSFELPRRLAAITRLIPQRLIVERIGAELESALERLESRAQQEERAV